MSDIWKRIGVDEIPLDTPIYCGTPGKPEKFATFKLEPDALGPDWLEGLINECGLTHWALASDLMPGAEALEGNVTLTVSELIAACEFAGLTVDIDVTDCDPEELAQPYTICQSSGVEVNGYKYNGPVIYHAEHPIKLDQSGLSTDSKYFTKVSKPNKQSCSFTQEYNNRQALFNPAG